MKIRTIRYYLKEAFRSIIHNRFMSAASIFAVASSIFIVAVFYMLGANIEFFMSQLEAQMGMSVRLEEDVTDHEPLRQRILALPHVSNVTFNSREEALEGMRNRIGDAAVAGLQYDNPLRDSLFVELSDLGFHDEVERAIRPMEGVAEINSAAEFAGMLSTLSNIVQIISAILIIVLAGISIILITNTIRITVNARKTEINIMKYVGATDRFIRWPFIIEGMIIGFLGGLVPALISFFGYGRVVTAINNIPNLDFLEFLPEEEIMSYVIWGALILGVIIGLLGSITSVKRHLKV